VEWRTWRRENPQVIPDFREADLRLASLSWTDLAGADLSNANLESANLEGANLSNANLTEADLRCTILSMATLRETTLRWAKLRGAKLDRADLRRADFSWAELREAVLREADLTGAELGEVDLSEANCSKSHLNRANLCTARLINTNMDGATLTGACLWETPRAGWSIKGVICEYVYWDKEWKEKSVYRPGEFERLYADKTKIRLFFKDGFDPLEFDTLPALIKHLENSHPGIKLRMVGIKEGSGGIVVELAIENEGAHSPEQLRQLRAEIETTAQRAIEYERKFLAEEKQRLQLEGALRQSDAIIDKLILRPNYNIQGNYMNDTYNVSGQAGAVGQNAHAHDMTFNQVVNHFDLPALAKQLGELREEMVKRQDSSPQSVIVQGEAAKAELAAKEGNTSKVIEYLKAGGQGLLDIAKETGKELLTAAIKASMGMQ
jgi:uncharacterized protein YjbI with pentapeptide repeats